MESSRPTPVPERSAHHVRTINPLYQKASLIILGAVALGYALVVSRAIVVPLLFALLLAILLDPIASGLRRRKVPEVMAIALAVLLAMLVLSAIGYFLATQAANFADSVPAMKKQLDVLYREGLHWANDELNMKRRDVEDAVEQVQQGASEGGSIVGSTLTTVGALFGFLFLLPVCTFLLLLNKRILMNFVIKWTGEPHERTVRGVFCRIKTVVRGYLVGLMFEAGIVASLNFVGLLLIGIDYALLMAVLGALLNLIPYIGMIIATALPMMVALASKDPAAALWVLGLYAAVQFIDNNFLVPKVVGSRVELNALVSLLAVMVGGALWGIPGMFLALPLTAIVKVVCDRVPALEPFGYVLGEDDGETERKDHRELFQLKAARRAARR